MPYNETLAKRIRLKLPRGSAIQEKKMFGGVGFLVNGNMACGVHKQEMIVRLGEAGFTAALKLPGVRIFNMTGRPMKGWLMVSEAACASDKALDGWIKKSTAFARSLPPK